MKHFDEAIKLKPDFAEAHANKGAALYGGGRHKDAIRSLEKANSLKPGIAEVLNNLGIAFLESGREKEGHRYLLEAVRLKPDYKEAIYNLSLTYYLQGDHQKSWQQFNLLQRLDENLAVQLKKQFWQKYVVNVSEFENK